MRRRLQVVLGVMALAAALAACSSPTPTPTPTATPVPTPTPVPTATPEAEPAPGGPSLAQGIAMLTGPLSAESESCLDGLQANDPDLTLETLMAPGATMLTGMRFIACLSEEEAKRIPGAGEGSMVSPSMARCVLDSTDEEALASVTTGEDIPPALMMAMGVCMGGLPDDGTVSNPNDGTSTFTPPSPEERAAFIAGFADVRGVDEAAAACVADGLTAIGVSLNVERFLTAVVTEGPIAVVLAECGVPQGMPLPDSGG